MNITSDLFNQLCRTLEVCGPFEDDRTLRAMFVDARLSQWRNSLPQATNLKERVYYTVDFLRMQKNDLQENALVLFLRVLAEHISPTNACHRELVSLSSAIEQIPDDSTSKDQFTTTDELFSKAIQFNLRGELSYALQLFEQIKQVNPNYPRIDSHIRAAKSELQAPYPNRYGEVQPNKLLEHYPRPIKESRPRARHLSRISCIVGLIVLIVIIVIIILLWKFFLPF